MVEPVDTRDLKSRDGNVVRVRVPPSAPVLAVRCGVSGQHASHLRDCPAGLPGARWAGPAEASTTAEKPGLQICWLAIPAGFEPATLCLEGRCSIRLSYGTSAMRQGTPMGWPGLACAHFDTAMVGRWQESWGGWRVCGRRRESGLLGPRAAPAAPWAQNASHIGFDRFSPARSDRPTCAAGNP